MSQKYKKNFIGSDTYDLEPHPKQNMTSPMGRLVERTTYLDILIISFFVITLSSIWFCFAPCGHGVDKDNLSFLSYFYFSLVTFASLGYGDILPVGFGRLISLLDVLSGLALTAVFIGKLASERQSSILLLLHTSDTQRRIADFSKEIAGTREIINDLTNQNLADLNILLDSHIALNKAIKNYLMFNAHQASIVEFGNFTALNSLYDEIKLSFITVNSLHRNAVIFGDVTLMRRTYVVMNFFQQIVARMGALHHNPKNRSPLWQATLQAIGVWPPADPPKAEQSARNRLNKLLDFIAVRMKETDKWIEIGYHPIQVEKVFKAFPAGPRNTWQTGVHKIVANHLGISNNVVTHCVDELLKAKRLPK